MKKVLIIDYGLSNLRSVKNAFNHLGVNTIVSHNSEDIIDADILVLPGVGAFEDGMRGLSQLKMVDRIKEKVNDGTPLLGICLGMQMLFDESEEFGHHKGLGLIPGRVERIPSIDINGNRLKVPHVSWNPLYPSSGAGNFTGTFIENINAGEECYFIHSYEAKPLLSDFCLAETEYGGHSICAIAQKDNVIGMQFHPEKSGEVGLRILKRYVEMYS